MAERLGRDGAAVAVNYRRDADAAADVCEAIVAAGGTARAYSASVDDDEATARMVEAISSDLGDVDLLVSNAGSASRGNDIETTSREEFEFLMRVHAFGPISLIQRLLPGMRRAARGGIGRGDVVAISSTTTASTPPNSAPYTMAKTAMETCIRTLAQEENSNGIHANIVAPGLVATDMGRRLVSASQGADIADLDATSPFGRVCRPEDVAGVVSFLISQDSGYVTGQRVVVDGGGPRAVIF